MADVVLVETDRGRRPHDHAQPAGSAQRLVGGVGGRLLRRTHRRGDRRGRPRCRRHRCGYHLLPRRRHDAPRRPFDRGRGPPTPAGRCAAHVPQAAGRGDQRGLRGRGSGAGAVLPRPLRRRHGALLDRVRPARLIAEYGIAWTLPRLVGLENALDLLLSGRTFDASEAKELGVVSRVVPRDDVLAAAQDYARDVGLQCAPSAVAVIAAQVRDAAESDYAAALERAYVETDKRIGSADLREGVASWLEKRPPLFPALPAERG